MGVDNFTVTFNKPNRIYFSGDTFTITIDVTSNSGFKLNEISGTVIGHAYTEWQTRSNNTIYINRGGELYLNKKFIIFKKPEADSLILPPGQYSYQFTYQIPHDIPPSFDESERNSIIPSTIGMIQYFVTVTMDRPWNIDDIITRPFIIQSIFDLNKYPSLREPAGTIMEKNMCCCFNSGQIEAIVKIPYKGYVVGQNIPLSVQIENCSNRNITDILVTMRKRNKFYDDCKAKFIENYNTVKSQQSLGVKVNAGETYAFCFNYIVPNVPVINMMDCSIIDVEYFLKFKLVLSGLTCNMTGQLPIYVGHVPLDNSQLPNEPLPYELLEIPA